MRLLLIEDNAPLRNAVGQFLREAGFIVDTAATGDEGLWAPTENPYDTILLDLMLPNVDGMEILRRLRVKGNPVHILVISARDGLEERLEALDAGADDYLVKPFPLTEALARVRALLRRSYVKKSPVMQVADVRLDPIRRTQDFSQLRPQFGVLRQEGFAIGHRPGIALEHVLGEGLINLNLKRILKRILFG